MRRIVVAIDPAVSVSESSDETGLIVAGVGTDGHGYVLEDRSGKYSPIDWARMAVSLYQKWQADRIVAEANQGGEMVETTIRTVDRNVSLNLVHASKGKILGLNRSAPYSSRTARISSAASTCSRINFAPIRLAPRIRRIGWTRWSGVCPS